MWCLKVFLVIQGLLLFQSPADNEAVMIDRLSLKARHNRAYLYRERMKNLARQKLQQRDFKKDDKSVDNAIKDSSHFKESDQGNQLLNEEIFQDKSLTFTADDLPTVNDVKVVDSVVLENKPSSKTSTKLKDFSQEFIEPDGTSKENSQVSQLENVNISHETEEEEKSDPPASESSPQNIDLKENSVSETSSPITLQVEPSSEEKSKQENDKLSDTETSASLREKDSDSTPDPEKRSAEINDKPIQPTLEPDFANEVGLKEETPFKSNVSEASTSKTPINEKSVEAGDDDLQSFEEWKKKQIQSKEHAATSDNQGSPPRTVRTKKTQMNYASQDCGAKVLSHNSEAKHVGAILDENKDLYMLNPCSNQIWFVVELCEPIQVEQVQLANLELFSSMPHLFNLYISERYPARKWRSLGTYEARNERAVQTFVSKQEDVMFAKYLKFEMKSHFGNEHFCPLTLIRVLGVSMVEEYENHEEEKSIKDGVKVDKVDAKTPVLKVDQNTDKKKNEDNTSEKAEESGSIGKVLNMVKSAVDNLLGNGKTHNTTTTQGNQTDSSSIRNDSHEDTIDPEWESPVTLVTNKTEFGEPSLNRPIITLIETGEGQEVERTLYLPHLYPLNFLRNMSSKSFGTRLCWFLEFMYRVSILSCVVPNSNRTSTSDAFSYVVLNASKHQVRQEKTEKMIENPKNPDFVLVESEPKEIAKPNIDSKTVPDSNVDIKLPDKITPNSTKIENKTDSEIKTKEAELNKEIETSRNFSSESELNSEKSESVVTSPDSIPNNEKTDAKPVYDETSVIGKVKADEEERQSEIKEGDFGTSIDDKKAENINGNPIQSEIKDEAMKEMRKDGEEDNKNEASVNNKEEKATGSEEQSTLNPVVETTPAPISNDSIKKNVSTPIPPVLEEKKEKVSELDTVVINPGTNQKESVLMRLSNRIRTLEQNLSLSSAYLENLSRRYKRQMDEMQKAFDQTQNRLKEMSQLVEDNHRNHDEVLSRRKEEVDELTDKLADFEESTEQLNRFMIARHFCLMAIESIVLIVIGITCFGTRRLRLLRRIENMEDALNQLQRSNQHKSTNGHAKFPSNHFSKHNNAKSRDRLSSKDLVVVNPRSKSKSSLDMDQLATLFASSSTSSISNTSLHRKKSLKTLNSPIKKRKNSHTSSKVTKASSKSSSTSLTGNNSRWTTDVIKEQKSVKSKKNGSKKDMKKFLNKNPGSNPNNNNNLYPSHEKVFSSSACYNATSIWDRYTSFSSLVGKAR